MSAAIKHGDLVMVVRGMPCCGSMHKVRYGQTFVAKHVVGAGSMYGGHPRCGMCHVRFDNDTLVAHDDVVGAPLSMLKKIDPPATGDSLPTREELTERA